jgi:hypothetical protein
MKTIPNNAPTKVAAIDPRDPARQYTPDYIDGWNDCRTYSGEDTSRSEEYRKGFSACLKAYHEGGWQLVILLSKTKGTA